MLHSTKQLLLQWRGRAHRTVFALSGGRLLARWGGLPVLSLTTTGRRSGRQRSTMLVSPVRQGGAPVVVASNGGHVRHPDWFLNLLDQPAVRIVMVGETGPRRARVASAEERSGLWARIVAGSPSYGRYQERTIREIPLVVLEKS